MTHQTETLALLRDTEHYLSALHGSVARHDNLAANYGCAGCELRDRIAAAVSAAVAPPTDQAALRDRIAEALMQWAESNNSTKYASMRRPATVVQNAYSRADAVLAVLPSAGCLTPEYTDGPCHCPACDPAAHRTDRAAVLRELATQQEQTAATDVIRRRRSIATARRLFAAELRRMADETATQTPDAEELERGRAQLLEAMSAVSEDRTCSGWASDWARTLHVEGGIWETLGRAVGWPTGNYDQWVWVSWDEAAALYAAGARQDETATETPHTCKPGASTYYCPTSGQTESDCHGGFTTCCDRPDLHQPAAGARQDGAQP